MGSPEVVVLIVGSGSIVFAGVITKMGLAHVWRSRSLKARKEMQNRLMDKFSSAPEFAQFLETSSGKQFMESVSEGPVNAHEKILSTVRGGLILVFLGAALLSVTGLVPSDGRIFLRVFGVIGMMVGVGLIISSYVSYRLSKAWGLLTPPLNRS
jgi:hypothetical protein